MIKTVLISMVGLLAIALPVMVASNMATRSYAAVMGGRAHSSARAGAPDPSAGSGVPRLNIASPPGVPAIAPITPTVDMAAAGFARGDVERYLGGHRLFKAATPDGGKVSKVLFITAAQASTLLQGEYIGRPDTALVCYVEISGPLSAAGLPHPRGAGDIPASISLPKGVLVFDAQTGNLLLQGFPA